MSTPETLRKRHEAGEWRLSIPALDFSSFPLQETETIGLIQNHLIALGGYFEDVTAAFFLFDTASLNTRSPAGKRWMLWAYVAARDAMMSIYHFGKTLEYIKSCGKLAPEFRSRIDQSKLKNARKIFGKNFPVFVDIRTAIAHSADLTSSLEKAEATALSSEQAEQIGIPSFGKKVLVRNHIEGNTFSTTFEGKFIRQEITPAVQDILFAVISEFYEAFNEVNLRSEASSLRPT